LESKSLHFPVSPVTHPETQHTDYSNSKIPKSSGDGVNCTPIGIHPVPNENTQHFGDLTRISSQVKMGKKPTQLSICDKANLHKQAQKQTKLQITVALKTLHSPHR